ncbi:hypothetical protein EVAR_60356_1 [Eumeta japonica]|uniref:Uncharacterized protein n=1 Tax=Eumeta variegata TaxID=151549 RepID=A0A4C1ZK31_EUMVA|nr:hypothetical protein EVAR_60356_1 [Eumeta japonica]
MRSALLDIFYFREAREAARESSPRSAPPRPRRPGARRFRFIAIRLIRVGCKRVESDRVQFREPASRAPAAALAPGPEGGGAGRATPTQNFGEITTGQLVMALVDSRRRR